VTRQAGCPLCDGTGGRLVFQAARWRLIHAPEPGFPAFYRVVWSEHAREFSDLSREERADCLEAVVQVEEVLRHHLQPAKVNLASLGNVVPHLHWHVIARFEDDSHFPAPVWAAPARQPNAALQARIEDRLPALERDLLGKLGSPA
jgi:diadenosine tetraphosphate (Ap4A) HIT family hydrolase